MLRSLFSSISGLRSHQIRMDVIGNNIANVNTTGYKSGRVTFEESMAQLITGPTRPGDKGGTNPVQVGLGMSVGSVDTKFTQGNLEATGQITDMAIEGDAFFAVSNGEGNFYTRNGAFQVDAAGQLVLPTNGFILQGKLADSDGNIPPAAIIEDVKLPLNQQSPAQATSEVDFSRNLDSDSIAKGSILYSQRFLHQAEATDNVQSMYDSSGRTLGIQTGDILTVSGQDVNGVTRTRDFEVRDSSSMNDVRLFIDTFLKDDVLLGGLGHALTTAVDVVTIQDDVNAVPPANYRGGLTVHGNTAAIQNLQMTTNRPVSRSVVTKAFAVPSTIPANSLPGEVVTDTFRSTARASDRLAELYDSNGRGLGMEQGDEISFFGELGGESIANVPEITYTPGQAIGTGTPVATANTGTTLQEVLARIKDNFQLPDSDMTADNNPTVSLNPSGSDDNIPDGSIVVRGLPEEAFAIKNLTVSSTNSNNSNPTPLVFNANMSFTTLQAATDTGTYETSIVVYDEAGDDHTMTMKFIHSGTPNNWLWELGFAGQEEVVQGQRGKLTFNQDGSVSSFTYDDSATELVVDPKNGSSLMRIGLNMGGPGDFTGMTQFRSPTTAAAVGQDGYAMGQLREVSIDPNGVISGSFTNGVSKALAQILVVDFTNPSGLTKLGDSVFQTSANSGDPIFGIPGSQSPSTIRPGALELSNVELAQEFTDMITTQRGYQANARVITVSDSLLEELVALKR